MHELCVSFVRLYWSVDGKGSGRFEEGKGLCVFEIFWDLDNQLALS
jgi:hypothetical protein